MVGDWHGRGYGGLRYVARPALPAVPIQVSESANRPNNPLIAVPIRTSLRGCSGRGGLPPAVLYPPYRSSAGMLRHTMLPTESMGRYGMCGCICRGVRLRRAQVEGVGIGIMISPRLLGGQTWESKHGGRRQFWEG